MCTLHTPQWQQALQLGCGLDGLEKEFYWAGGSLLMAIGTESFWLQIGGKSLNNQELDCCWLFSSE